MEILKAFVGGLVLACIVLMFVYYLWTKCKNDDPNTLLNKAIGFCIGVAIMALGIWVLS